MMELVVRLILFKVPRKTLKNVQTFRDFCFFIERKVGFFLRNETGKINTTELALEICCYSVDYHLERIEYSKATPAFHINETTNKRIALENNSNCTQCVFY